MKKIKIRYKNRSLLWLFFFGLAWIAVGIATFFFSGHGWTGYFYLGLGVFSMIVYFYYNEKQYLTIKDGVLTKNDVLLSKSIRLDEVKTVKYFAGDYTLITGRKNLTIETNPIDKQSLEELKSVLNGLDAEMKVVRPN